MIPKTKNLSAMYCCDAHTKAESNRKRYIKQKIETEAKALYNNPSLQRQKREGKEYKWLDANRYELGLLLSGDKTATAHAQQ
jgi:hypothetical protein